MLRHKAYVIAVAVEIIGIAVVGTGIGLELAQGGYIFLCVITGGSLMIAAGGLLFAKFVRR